MNSAADVRRGPDHHALTPNGDALRGWVAKLRDLYEGDTPEAHRFRYGLLAFDLVTVLFIVVTSFLPRTPLFEALDVLFGLGILADISRPTGDLPEPLEGASEPAHSDRPHRGR